VRQPQTALLLEGLEAADLAQGVLGRAAADGAGVDEDQVGVGFVVCGAVAQGGQLTQDGLAVRLVHLAAVRAGQGLGRAASGQCLRKAAAGRVAVDAVGRALKAQRAERRGGAILVGDHRQVEQLHAQPSVGDLTGILPQAARRARPWYSRVNNPTRRRQ
jgi:hypothetical protein